MNASIPVFSASIAASPTPPAQALAPALGAAAGAVGAGPGPGKAGDFSTALHAAGKESPRKAAAAKRPGPPATGGALPVVGNVPPPPPTPLPLSLPLSLPLAAPVAPVALPVSAPQSAPGSASAAIAGAPVATDSRAVVSAAMLPDALGGPTASVGAIPAAAGAPASVPNPPSPPVPTAEGSGAAVVAAHARLNTSGAPPASAPSNQDVSAGIAFNELGGILPKPAGASTGKSGAASISPLSALAQQTMMPAASAPPAVAAIAADTHLPAAPSPISAAKPLHAASTAAAAGLKSGADSAVSAGTLLHAGTGMSAGAAMSVGACPSAAGTAAGTAAAVAASAPQNAPAMPSLALGTGIGSHELPLALAGHVSWLVDHNLNGASLQVNPPHLGPIELRVSIERGRTDVWMSAQSPATRDALQSSAPSLRDLLGGQGFGQVNVDVSQRSFQGGSAYAQANPPPPPLAEGSAAAAAIVAAPLRAARSSLGALDAYA